MAKIIPFAERSASNRRVFWVYIKFPPFNSVRITGKDQHVTVWVGPFMTEAQQIVWRSEFETELERLEYKNYEIRSTPSGRSYPKPEKADIDPRWSAEEAVGELPRIISYKTDVSAVQ